MDQPHLTDDRFLVFENFTPSRPPEAGISFGEGICPLILKNLKLFHFDITFFKKNHRENLILPPLETKTWFYPPWKKLK